MIVVIGDLIDDVVVLGASRLQRGTDNPAAITHARGGSAANVAAAIAPLQRVRFIGRIGADAAGEALVRGLEDAGVEVRVQRSGRTGSIVVLVDEDGERTMLTDRAAAGELGPIDAAWLADARWLHVPLYGFLEEGSAEAIFAAAERVRGVPVSIDLSSVDAMRRLGPRRVAAILQRMGPDVVFANADEAGERDAAGLALPAGALLVIKRGGEPVRIVSDAGIVEVPVTRATRVVDSTGAGDAFAAGYIAASVTAALPAAAATAGAQLALSALDRAGAI